MHLCHVFKNLCAKIVDPTQFGEFKKEVEICLVLLEKEFPPSFFDIMTHLLVHLVEELQLCGPIHTCWMYPIEQYIKILKGFVQNKTRLKGSMVEGYALEEALGFCIEYIQGFIATRKRVWDDKEDPNMIDEMLEGNGRLRIMTTNLRNMAHYFVLQNVELMSLWCKDYLYVTHLNIYYNAYWFIVGLVTSRHRDEILSCAVKSKMKFFLAVIGIFITMLIEGIIYINTCPMCRK